MSSGASVSQQLRRMDRRKALAKAPPPLKVFLEEVQEAEPLGSGVSQLFAP
jgi:hypothetical protein